MKSLQFTMPTNEQLAIRQRLFDATAALLHRTPQEIERFCDGGDWDAVLIVTPEDLAAQIKEYEDLPTFVCDSCGNRVTGNRNDVYDGQDTWSLCDECQKAR